MTRELPEWRGKTPDTPVPPRVKLRVLERYNRTCYLSGRPINPARDEWDAEHVIAIINGGENRENNLKPALKAPHRKKTKADMAIKKRTAKRAKKNAGLHKPKRIMAGSRKSKWKKPFGGGPPVLRSSL